MGFTDFVKIAWKMGSKKGEPPEIYPKFNTKRSNDLMIRGGDFYAIWDERNGRWSTDQDDVIEMIDEAMEAYKKNDPDHLGDARIAYMWDGDSGSIDKWRKYVTKQTTDHYHALDETLIFENSVTKRENYSSKHLPYSLEPGNIDAWNELLETLYAPEERHKIEWAIGSVVSGDSKWIQKFFVFYGAPGCGKGTILDIIKLLFQGYCETFEAAVLGNSNSDFALSSFKDNPIVAIDPDANLSRIETNTRLNALVSHETLTINEKFKSQYSMQIQTMLFIATNSPVRITDSKSGLLRRMIDISPTGNKIPNRRYLQLKKNVGFELGAIAAHCLEVYQEDPHYYDDYVPLSMMGATNDFYNFMLEYYEEFKSQNGTTLNDAWFKYRLYCDEAKVPYPYSKRIVKEELKNYFMLFKERGSIDGEMRRNVYTGFRIEKFENDSYGNSEADSTVGSSWLKFNTTVSQFDKIGAEWPAQYAYIRKDGSDKPCVPWDTCETILADLNTSELHYVRPPEEIRNKLVTVDFDKKDPITGEKSLELNMKAASEWLPTYAELSKSGVAIHLEYFYTGDVSKLAAVYEPDIEIKVFTGKASLRRKLTRCNDLAIATISSGLPLRKENKKTVNEYTIENQKHLVAAIRKALRKEISPYSTVCCVDYIGKVLQDAYDSGMKYDVSEFKPQVLAFAAASTHNALSCMDKAEAFPYKSEEVSEWVPPEKAKESDGNEKQIAFFDTEVFPNLFILCYKPLGKPGVKMINPSGAEVLDFFQTFNAIGFNNLGYDNHICYAKIRGDTNYELFVRSQNLINAPKGKNDWAIRESKNLSYTDVYDFCSEKKGLKKWEIALQKKGVEVKHDEAGIPWDQEVPTDKWERVAEYCMNDVIATEQVFLENQSDFKAREILVELANAIRGPGSTVNDSTNNLTMKLIVGNEKSPQALFNYPDLAKEFPGYEFNQYGIDRKRYFMPIDENDIPNNNPKLAGFYELVPAHLEKDEKGKDVWVEEAYIATKDDNTRFGKQYYRNNVISGKSFYKGFDPGEGGFVYAEPGMYFGAECYDSASHHPSSIIAENGFGPYTENFKMLLDIRLHIKHKDYDWVRGLYNGILAPYLTSDEDAKQLSKALKIAINSVYGLTAAHFPNKLCDPRNVDNWVAKRGALFMIDLMLEVKKRGYKVIHVKTDSIKIANPDEVIYQFVYDYGKKFGYTFEIEHKFDRICLVNDAVYICKYSDDPANGKDAGKWEGTGDQFKKDSSPYVFKTLFSHEPIDFYDMTETQTVKVGNGLYLDMDEDLPDPTELEKEEEKLLRKWKKVGYELTSENDANLVNGFAPNLTDVSDKKLEQYARDVFHGDYVRLCEVRESIRKCHNYRFIGKAGLFCPIVDGAGGGRLVRENNGKYAYAAGAKGWRWLEAEMVKELGLEDRINRKYFDLLADDAKDAINNFGDYNVFVS